MYLFVRCTHKLGIVYAKYYSMQQSDHKLKIIIFDRKISRAASSSVVSDTGFKTFVVIIN